MSKRKAARAWPYPFVRVYAAITSGRVVCPRCAALLVFRAARKVNTVRTAGVRRTRTVFDAVTSRLECPRCTKVLQVGMLLWEPTTGRGTRPADQQPTVRELAQLRGQAAGFWVAEQAKRPQEPVNRYVPETCCCAPHPWRAECPIHGIENQEEP